MTNIFNYAIISLGDKFMKNINFVVGHRGSGKTYMVQELKHTHDNILHIDTGPLLRKTFEEFPEKISFIEWINYGEKKYGKEFTNIVICKRMEKIIEENYVESIIVTGNRSIEGIEYIKKHFEFKNSKIIFLDAPFNCLKNNYNMREKTNLNDDEFQKIINLEKSMGLEILKEKIIKDKDMGIYIYKEKNEDITIEEFKKHINLNEMER